MMRVTHAPQRRLGATWLVSACLAWGLVLAGGPSLAAQELPFHRDYPRSGPYQCPDLPSPVAAPATPSPAALAQAAELASSSDQAVILGDLPSAAALLARGVELNPASAPLAYRRARVFEDLGQVREAVDEYCRALSLVSDEEGEEWRDRLQAVATADRAALSEDALASFQAGLAAADGGHLAAARISFGRAADGAPDWASAEYNRGVTLARLGSAAEAATALLRYLELRPDAPDAFAVARRIGQLQSPVIAPGPSPVVAAALGTLVPGMGQFYTGRAVGGLTVVLLAGGAAAAGYFIEEVDVRCLGAVPAGASCPEAQVVARRIERPYMYLGLGAAAGIAVIAAVEAYFQARARNRSGNSWPIDPSRSQDEADAVVDDGTSWMDALAVEGPSVYAHAGRIELSVLRIRFR